MSISFEINMVSSAWVVMFVVDDVLSKLKGFSFKKGKVIEVVVRIGSSLHFHRERDLYLFFQVKIVIVFTRISI